MKKGRAGSGSGAGRNVRKTVSVERKKMEQLRLALRAPSDAEAIRRAIDFVLFRHRQIGGEEE